MFSINTNVASLQAQNYLQQTNDREQEVIAQVTSGLRIVHSGDDAAGLAVANSYASDEAVLTQGIRNANDGLSELQIIDGGENNISQLLDRARTLATQSASDTFTGDRSTLNSEFQSVIQEISREAQAIGLNQGGQFATSLSLFVGGGKAAAGGSSQSAVDNGIETLNLSQATVDAKSLGLTGVQVVGGTTGVTDLGNSSSTSVAAIIGNVNNQATETQSGYTEFYIHGPGFSSTSGSDVVKLAVNLSGVTDANTLANAINTAINAAGEAGNPEATAFKNANIAASAVTDSTGKTQLTFSSSTSAFQVQAGDATANALLGNFATAGQPQGVSASASITASTAASAATSAETVQLRVLGAGLASAQTVTVSIAGTETTSQLVDEVNAALSGNSSVAATGITASLDGNGKIVFTGKADQTFEVQSSGDQANFLGLGTFVTDSGNNFDYNSITAAGAATASTTQGVQVSINGGATIDLGTLNSGASEDTALAALNQAFQGNSQTRAAGLTAVDNGGDIEIVASTGVNFRLNLYAAGAAQGDAFGFGAATTGDSTSVGSLQSSYATKTQLDAQGENQSNTSSGNDVFSFVGLRNLNDAQTITVSAVDGSGRTHSLDVSLNTSNAGTLDQAIDTINKALQQSDDSTLQSLVSFKELNNAGTQEGVRFASSSSSFSISLGSTTNGVGLSDAGTQSATDLLTSSQYGSGGTADISNQASAAAAVTALASAVTLLGAAQATIGLGENEFTYASNLAQSQLTNEQAAEAQIRDADLAQASANLTKQQILLQAGVAALAQANSAPQQLLSLLQGR